MDQVKIGKFISERRRSEGLTQARLAEKLNITDRAVSKWETGKSLPDSSIMLELCGLLHITVNDLLNGEVVSMNNYNEIAEKNLLETVRQKEEADRRLLTLEIVIGLIASLFLITLVLLASYIDMRSWLRIALIIFGFAVFIVAVAFCVRIEQTAGYYECGKCRHRYIPSYGSVLWSMHANRTRYMKCPHCGKRSWHKKVIGKDK